MVIRWSVTSNGTHGAFGHIEKGINLLERARNQTEV